MQRREILGQRIVRPSFDCVLGMSDRTLVMHEGRITGELSREQLSEEAIMQLATGNPSAA